MVGLEKTITCAKISLKMVNPRDVAGKRRRRSRHTNTVYTTPHEEDKDKGVQDIFVNVNGVQGPVSWRPTTVK